MLDDLLEAWRTNLAAGLVKFESKDSPTKKQLKNAMTASSLAIEKLFTGVTAGEPGRRGFKKGASTMLAYFVAHESHHRGNILLTIKECGHNLSQAERYAIWDWDRI